MRIGLAVGTAAGIGLAACSSFNMLPGCEQTTHGLLQSMVASNGEPLDEMRLASLVSLSTPQEIGAGYNERTCRTEATAFGQTRTITYTVRQSEGVKGWGEFMLPTDSGMISFIARLHAAYAQ